MGDDSVDAGCPRRRFEGEMGDQHMGLQDAAHVAGAAQGNAVGSRNGATVVFINQIRIGR